MTIDTLDIDISKYAFQHYATDPASYPQQLPGKSSITLANAHRRLAAPLWDIRKIPTQPQSTSYATKGGLPLRGKL
jgi:hypothetical protein